jgi:hypothetical protein
VTRESISPAAAARKSSADDADSVAATRLAVALHIIHTLTKELTEGTDGACALAVAVFTSWPHELISGVAPSPRFLVHLARQPGGSEDAVRALASKTLELLCTALLDPELNDAASYRHLVNALAVCLNAGPSHGRPGSGEALEEDMSTVVSCCCRTIKQGLTTLPQITFCTEQQIGA